jgi:ankyrin repeat protein
MLAVQFGLSKWQG